MACGFIVVKGAAERRGEWHADSSCSKADSPWSKQHTDSSLSKQQQSGVASGMQIRHGQVNAEAERRGAEARTDI